MSAVSELKVYRPPLLCLALGWVVFAAFFLVGMSMVTIGPSQRGGASAAVVGALVLLLSLGIGAALATNRLIVTPAGLVYSFRLRRRAVSWAEIQSFGVGASRGMLRWPTLVIGRNDGLVLVKTDVWLLGSSSARGSLSTVPRH